MRNIFPTILWAFLFCIIACETSPKQARLELINQGYRYTEDGFIKSIKRSDYSAISLFVLAGIDPNTSRGGYSTLEYAASDSIALSMLLRSGANPNKTGGVTTPLIEATKNGSLTEVSLLIKNGANPNGSDAVGGTPLMAASKIGAIDIVELLIEKGAQVNIISNLGTTALSMANTSGHSAIVQKLVTMGARSNFDPDLQTLSQPEKLHKPAPAEFKAEFKTSMGNFHVKVVRAWAPRAADRFYTLLHHGFFNTLYFFRVVPNRLVQFGLHNQPEISSQWKKATIKDEESFQLENQRGTIAFASAEQPASRSTQIFINLTDNSDLDAAGFVPFARVTSGMEVLDAIYSGYGEIPDQKRIFLEGKQYLENHFPLLDYIKTTHLLE
ncbi:MAG: ankyrin repeat domain-containing protein [Candidatus Latescibacterota bacterium]|nr:ankyrin repeat domain-containing protein [Candidatus Latescibacterota bacterium]